MLANVDKLLERRIAAFAARLKDLVDVDTVQLAGEYCLFSPMVPFEQRLAGAYTPIVSGMAWGKNWQRAWFHLIGEVPRHWKGKPVAARIDLGGEGLTFAPDGKALGALSVHSIWSGIDFRRDRIPLFDSAEGGERVDLWIEASAGQLFGLRLNIESGWQIPREFGQYEAVVHQTRLVLQRPDIWQLYLDVRTMADLMGVLPENGVRRRRLRRALTGAADLLTGMADEETVERCRTLLKPEMEKHAAPTDLQTTAVGHAHLDTAWLWPVEESIAKCGRTFAAQLALLERYPQYQFGASSAQHYAFVKERYPEIYRRVSDLVAKGRWEIQGALWVEADCNLVSGESLVRQILHGKRFWKEEFGIEPSCIWLPDVFGYSAALPQIMKKSGLDYLVTQKLSWNQFNRFPHHTFRWRGIDGSEVLCHFPPEDNYSSELLPSGLVRARDNFDESAYLDEFLTLFGIGDGGGGPTEEMIEAGLRQKNLESCPRVAFGRAEDFLKRLAEKRPLLPLWEGELYLELHRGTYTTQAANKRYNRKLELKLRELEILYCALPWIHYPAGELERAWKTVLLLQFHDILPGSSVTPVYEQSRSLYQETEQACTSLLNKAAVNLFKKNPDSLCLVNTTSYFYRGVVALPATWQDHEILDSRRKPVPTQPEESGSVALVTIPPLCAAHLYRGPEKKYITSKTPLRHTLLENDRLRAEFSDKGILIRLLDKKLDRELMAAGMEGNRLELFEDRPVDWDAWDIDIFTLGQRGERARLLSAMPIAIGSVRQGITFRWAIGNSDIVQRIYLTEGSRRLDFETEVDWREDHKLLRIAFPVDVASEFATYDVQFGTLRRPTHRNTSWEMAKFEVPAQRFADLSENDYGVALLSDCKYGYRVLGNELSLSLLRSPLSPDPTADRGHHRFTASLLPHPGSLVQSDVFSQAAQLNQPPACFPGMEGWGFRFPFSLDNEEVVMEAVKKAEAEEAAIVRLYEPRGKEVRVVFSIPPGAGSIWEADLMEKFIRQLDSPEGRLELRFRPFEIKTLKIVWKRPAQPEPNKK